MNASLAARWGLSEPPAVAGGRSDQAADPELDALMAKVARMMPAGSRRDWWMVAEIIRRCPSFPD